MALIRISRSLEIANALLSLAQSRIDEEDKASEFAVSPYKNGREEGWFIISYKTLECVAFAEDIKHENQIVLYKGHKSEFDNSNLLPNHQGVILSFDDAVSKVTDFLNKEDD